MFLRRTVFFGRLRTVDNPTAVTPRTTAGRPGALRRLAAAAAVVLVLIVPGRLTAADSSWRALADRTFRVVADNSSMPHALIPMAIAQGSDGFMWLGGEAGLVRWDGYAFRDYAVDDISSRRPVVGVEIVQIHMDGRHVLWVVTGDGRIAHYDASQDRFVTVPLSRPGDGKTGDIQAHARVISDSRGGGLWIGTDDGLWRLNEAGAVALWQKGSQEQQESLPEGRVFALLQDRKGTLWVGTAEGLKRSVNGGRSFERVLPRTVSASAVSQIVEDGEGRIWISTRYGGAFLIAENATTARRVPGSASLGAAGTATQINTMTEIAPGRIWMGTQGNGILEVDEASLASREIVHNPLLVGSLDDDAVEVMYRDRSGLIWVSTEGGVSRYSPAAEGILTFIGNRLRPDGLPGSSVQAILAGQGNTLWAGMQNNGFVVLDPAGRRTTGLTGTSVFAMATSPAGGVIIGTEGGLFHADPSGGTVRRLVVPGLSPKVDIRTMAVFGGEVLLSSIDGSLWELRVGVNDDLSVIRHESAAHLKATMVATIGRSPDGRIAVGSDNGLDFIDRATDRIEHIAPKPDDPNGLDGRYAQTLLDDGHGRLWIGTENGLDVLLGHDTSGRPIFRSIGLANGLPNTSVNGLEIDATGRIWAATDKGLAVIDPVSFQARALTRADGLAITNYWNDSSAVLPGGELVFGGVGGITVVLPDAVSPWTYAAPVVVTSATIGDRTMASPGVGPLTVMPYENSLSVEFAALDFSAPEANRYQYRLDPFDSAWTSANSSHRVATYDNLPPGRYNMRIRGSNRNGLWTEQETAIRVVVLPAWFQTAWFHFTVVGFLVGTVILTMRGWTAILRQRQRHLERQVEQRTLELSASKRDLQHANDVLELRVTERTAALFGRTEALEASEARFQAWFNNAEDGVFALHVQNDGIFVFESVNSSLAQMTGIPADKFIGRKPEVVFSRVTAEQILANYREAAEGRHVKFETRMNTDDGVRLIHTWIAPLRNSTTGRVERLIGAARDITERCALEERLAQTHKIQVLGGLAGGIAHDFNNILQAVASTSTQIEQRPEDAQKVRSLARIAIAAAERGTSIANRLLAFARSDDLKVEAVPTGEVMEGLSEMLAHTLGGGIDVHARISADLPNLLADRGHLETAVINLGTNARDAMNGTGVLTLSVKKDTVPANSAHRADLRPGSYIRIDVTDTGCGMDAPTLARVVEPFFTTKPRGQGTGLGLPLVKGFAEQSGGGMAISSVPGVGTTVSMWLRQAAGNAGSEQPEDLPSRGRGRDAAFAARILLVDDDELVRESFAGLLECNGFEVLVAESCEQALADIGTSATPDIMICDYSMPGTNGVETIRRMREVLPGLPCLLLTGFVGDLDEQVNGDDLTLLRKPITIEVLIANIESRLTPTDALETVPARGPWRAPPNAPATPKGPRCRPDPLPKDSDVAA
jgi:PAS domain S-box-containing protein